MPPPFFGCRCRRDENGSAIRMKTYTLHYAHGETVSGLTFTAALTAVAAKHGVSVQELGIVEDHMKQSSRILIWLPGDQEKNNINRAVAELLTVED